MNIINSIHSQKGFFMKKLALALLASATLVLLPACFCKRDCCSCARTTVTVEETLPEDIATPDLKTQKEVA